MVRALAVAALLLAPTVADAAMMTHYDLAGLVMHGDTIIVADRVAAMTKQDLAACDPTWTLT